jgi:hypothetical protein
MFVNLYFVWVCYSYWIYFRNEKYTFFKGNFYSDYEEYDSMNQIKLKNLKEKMNCIS